MVTKVKPLTILSLLLPFMVSLFLLAKGAHCFEGKKKLHLHKLQWQQKSGSSSSCVSHQKSSEFSSFWVSGGKRKWSWVNLFKCWPCFDLISFNFNYSPLWKLLFCFIYGNTYYYPLSLPLIFRNEFETKDTYKLIKAYVIMSASIFVHC